MQLVLFALLLVGASAAILQRAIVPCPARIEDATCDGLMYGPPKPKSLFEVFCCPGADPHKKDACQTDFTGKRTTCEDGHGGVPMRAEYVCLGGECPWDAPGNTETSWVKGHDMKGAKKNKASPSGTGGL